MITPTDVLLWGGIIAAIVFAVNVVIGFAQARRGR